MQRHIEALCSATAYDNEGHKLGAVKKVYLHDTTGEPEFAEVGHGRFGLGSSVVPLQGHRLDNGRLELAFPRDRIKGAPRMHPAARLTERQYQAILSHFRLMETANLYKWDTGAGVRGWGDDRIVPGASADRERALSDERNRVDQDDAGRARRGTSAHGMSDEPREQYRDYQTAERSYARLARYHQNDFRRESGDDLGAAA